MYVSKQDSALPSKLLRADPVGKFEKETGDFWALLGRNATVSCLE